MEFSKVLIIVIFIYLISIWTTFAIFGENTLIDLNSLLLMSLLILVFEIFLLSSKGQDRPLIFLSVLTIFIFFCLRFWALIIFPDFIGYQDYYSFDTEDLNRVFLFMVVGTIAILGGFKLGSKHLLSNKRIQQKSLEIPYSCSIKILLIVSIGLLLANFLLIFFGIRIPTSVTEYNQFAQQYGYLFRFINPFVILPICIIITGERWQFFKKGDKAGIAIFFIGYVLLRYFQGSRGAFWEIFIASIIYIVIKKSGIRINKKFVSAVAILLLVGVIGFSYVTTIRAVWDSLAVKGLKGAISVSETFETLKSRSELNFKKTLEPVSFRLSGLDPLVVIMSEKGKDPKDYISFSNEMKYIANSVVPGDLFSDVIPSAQQFSQIYRSKSFREVKESYQSDMWSIFGTFFVHFGWFLGVILMFITAFGLAAIFKVISKLKTRYKIFLQFWLLFATYNLLISYGFGTWILSYIIYPFIDGAIILVILYIFSPRFLSPAVSKEKIPLKMKSKTEELSL